VAFVHPSNDMEVIKGQGTAAYELLQDAGELDLIVTPIGGGGLIAGTCLAVSESSPRTKVYGGEPLGADDAYHSLKAGKIRTGEKPNTIADGLRTSLGDQNFPIIQRGVADIIRVSEEDIIAAMRLIWERMKIVVEPSSAVALAAVLKDPATFKGRRTGIILSGGNADLDKLPF
jgi:threonine dehydratase